MFRINQDTLTIDMHRGDTGVIGITATDYTFNSDARAIFTVKDASGTIVKQGVYEMVNNRFEVVFQNGETDYLDAGQYEWDVRYVVGPIYDENGNIMDGSAVGTPRDPMTLNLRKTVGQI